MKIVMSQNKSLSITQYRLMVKPFLYCLFNNALSRSDCIMSNGRTISAQGNRKLEEESNYIHS
jgi:hypothetical protein